jgi:hypothetical protein
VSRRLSSLAFTCICGKIRGPADGLTGVLLLLTLIPQFGEGRTSKASDEVAGELVLPAFIFICGRRWVVEAPEELVVGLSIMAFTFVGASALTDEVGAVVILFKSCAFVALDFGCFELLQAMKALKPSLGWAIMEVVSGFGIEDWIGSGVEGDGVDS